MAVPFNRLCLSGRELDYVNRAVQQMHTAGDGPFSKQCQEILERVIGSPKTLLTTSCTHALEMAALLLDLQPGDEVIIPSFTFVSTVNAFALRGARPVFVDIRPDTLNLDERLIESAISPRTKAIVPVHYAGVGCEMDAIAAIAARHGLSIVEDNAHGLFGFYKDRPLGSFGRLSAQSFHETKNCTCGEGGALAINDPLLKDRAEIIREKGTNRSRFFRGQVDKYTWVDIGSSYLPADLLAAFLLAQLESYPTIQERRRAIWERYDQGLRSWATERGVRQPIVPEHCRQAYHMYYLLMPTLELRDGLIAHLKERGIAAVFHYLPLHMSEMGARYGGRAGDCPVTESTSDRLIRLPFFNELTHDIQDVVMDSILQFEFSKVAVCAT